MGHKQTLCADTWLQKVHFCVCLHHWSSSKLLVTHGAGTWLPESALLSVFAPLILFRTTCDTWCRDMAPRKCTFPCVCTIDPLQNYLWQMVQVYGFQKVHFFVFLHHGPSSELLVTLGAVHVSLCLHHWSSILWLEMEERNNNSGTWLAPCGAPLLHTENRLFSGFEPKNGKSGFMSSFLWVLGSQKAIKLLVYF